MRSMTLFFNKALHRSDWRRFWPLLFVYAAGWLVALPLAIWSMASHREEIAQRIYTVTPHIYGCARASVIVSAVFGLLLAMALFSYLMRASSVGLMHALPLTRGQQFANHFLVGVEIFTVGNVLMALFALLSQAAVGAVSMTATLNWLLAAELSCLFFFALGTACAMLTGWVLAIPVIYAGVNFAVLAIVAVLQVMGEEFYFGFDGVSIPAFAIWLTPAVKLFTAVGYDATYLSQDSWAYALYPEAIPTLLIYTAAALALIAVSYLLYRHRRSETAGDAIVFNWLKPVVKYVIAVAGGLGLGLFLAAIMYWNGLMPLLLCQFLMGTICYLAVEMLLQKRFKVFNRRLLLGLAALFAALTALTLLVRFDVGGYQTRVPKTAQVESVEVGFSGSYGYWYQIDDAQGVEKAVAVHQAVVDAYQRGELDTTGYTDDIYNVYLRYELTDGGTLGRNYAIPVVRGSALHQALNELMNLPSIRAQEIIDNYDPAALSEIRGGYATNWQTDEQIQLTRQQAQTLYEAFTRYIDSDTAFVDVLDYQQTRRSCIRVEFDTEAGTFLGTDQVSADCTEVLELLVEYGLADSSRELLLDEDLLID